MRSFPQYSTCYDAMKEGAPLVHDEYQATSRRGASGIRETLRRHSTNATSSWIIPSSTSDKTLPSSNRIPVWRYFDVDGRLTLHTSTQVPHYVMRTVAMVLQIPVGNVRVVKPLRGRRFRSEMRGTPLEMSCALLSKLTGKPVKMTYSREQVFLHSRARHQFFAEMSLGRKKRRHNGCPSKQSVLDGGAYTSFGIATVYYSGSLLGGPYKLKAMKYDGYRAYTNKPACGAQRGHGGVAHGLRSSNCSTSLRRKLGMDPLNCASRTS